ncbi:hypothetical protein IWQ60_009506, partial [Tieghemiomyces parasiticus]
PLKEDLANCPELWYRHWRNGEIDLDEPRRADEVISIEEDEREKENTDIQKENYAARSGEDRSLYPVKVLSEEEKRDRSLRHDYQDLRNKYLNDEVCDEDIKAMMIHMETKVWPIAKPLVQSYLYNHLLHLLHRKFITGLGNVYSDRSVPRPQVYPLKVEKGVNGITVIQNNTFDEYAEALNSGPPTSQSGRIGLRMVRDFRPELHRIHQATHVIKFHDMYDPTAHDPTMLFPLALVSGNIGLLVEWRKSITSQLGRYGIANMLYQGASIPSEHIQFIEALDGDFEADLILKTIGGENDETILPRYYAKEKPGDLRIFSRSNELLEFNVPTMFDQSVAVAFAALGQLNYLKAYYHSQYPGLPVTLRAYPHDLFVGIAIIVADRLRKNDFIAGISKWDVASFSGSEVCWLKDSLDAMNWEPRTESLKEIIKDCQHPSGSFHFRNDLPVFIGDDNEPYFKAFKLMSTSDPVSFL